ncbi:ATP-binding protein [Haliangium ochraceum]|uniref:Putative anti-sigma regulatory factor, serine/threonine protein kinase n=1 Tax=Haliangium ochraceum (strain DSM 14365 / JCM 11303 / SMP-2) TaxID=502025 RepID=D0LHI8_HALO1|nr:ATP-binding protein [Haliangium ochraceum]ACY12850.1 putative anti-sigma regulatory factor, serine/threonine protein kinase [Haliangium ochraceum DSM 14365]
MSEARVIALTVPGSLAFRDLAIRVIIESCRLVGSRAVFSRVESTAANAASAHASVDEADRHLQANDGYDLGDSFTAEFVSAFSEIYNNIPIHAYQGRANGSIDLRVEITPDRVIVELKDMGESFDIEAVPLPEALPTGGMGIHIARSMLDDLVYEPGPPNLWRLTKYANASRKAAASAMSSPPSGE